MTEIRPAPAVPLYTARFAADDGFRRRAARAVFPMTFRSTRPWFAMSVVLVAAVVIGYATSPFLGLLYGAGLLLLMLGLVWLSIRGSLGRHVAAIGSDVSYLFDDERISVEQGGKAAASTSYELFDRWMPVSDGYILRNFNRMHVFLPAEAVSPELAAFLDTKVNRRR